MVDLVVVGRDQRMRMRVDQPRQEGRVAQVDRLEPRDEQLRPADRHDPLPLDHHHRVAPDAVRPPVDEPRRAQGDPAR